MLDFLSGNDGLSALIAFAVVLIPAVIIHELGHFFAGKSVGITILEFGIGFPPRIGRLFTWRGTEFTLNWLPLGGFVRPLGEDMVSQKGQEEESEDRQEAEARGIENIKSVNEAKPLQRIWFLSAGAIANLVSAFLLFMLIGLLGVPGISLDVADVDENSPLYEAGLRPNDVIESVNGENFLVPEDFFGAVENSAGEEVNIVIRRGEEGEVINIPLVYNADPITIVDSLRVRVMGVEEESPASDAGIMPGDLVLTFDGEAVDSADELQGLVRDSLGETVSVELRRGGETISTELQPRIDPPPGQGAMGIQIQNAIVNDELQILFQPLADQVLVGLTLRESIEFSTGTFAGLFRTIADLPSALIQGRITANEARPVSIVGISQLGGRFLRESIEQQRPTEILNFIAFISIALGLTNLLPIPALDGGRILFVLIEMVRGRPIPPEREGVVHLFGLIFLLSVTVIVIINDILNPITELLP